MNKNNALQAATALYTLVYTSIIIAGNEVCIVGDQGFRPLDPTSFGDIRGSNSYMIWPDPKTKEIEILNGLASVRARVCTFQYSNSAQILIRNKSDSRVIPVAPYSCMDSYVPSVTILKECEPSKGCNPLPLEQWCLNRRKEPIRLRWKGEIYVKGYYARDYASADMSNRLKMAGVFTVDSNSPNLTTLMISTKKERIEVCTKPGSIIAINDAPLANAVKDEFKTTNRCTAVEGFTVWVKKPADASLLPITGSYRSIP